VTLRIPETSIPYRDVHQSTLRTLGAGRYERADEWTSFEAGHQRYGSTDLQPLDEPTLRALLLEFARRSPARVRPLDEHATPVIDAAEALALVREGRHSIPPPRTASRPPSGPITSGHFCSPTNCSRS